MSERNNSSDIHSLSHTKWNCKYHIVFAPKYRRKVFYNDFYDGIIKSSEMFEEMSEECNQKIEMFSAKKSTLAAELEKNRIIIENVLFIKLLPDDVILKIKLNNKFQYL